MTDRGDAELKIAIGTGVIVVLFFVKNFYWLQGRNVVSDKRMPTWIGRLLSWVIGGMMILVGLNFLFPPR